MNEQQTVAVASGRVTGKTDSQREQLEWRRRQAIQPAAPRYIEPTLPERINRLRPSERHELSALLKSMKLRKIIRRTLAEAFWNGQAAQIHATMDSDATTMQRLRATVRSQESMKSYERALTSFEPVMSQSQQPTVIEVPR